jgi:thioredoxin 1
MSTHVPDIGREGFNAKVEQGRGLVLVDFWAEWCGPCRALAPVLDQVAAEFAGRIDFAKVNVDLQRDLAKQHHIQSIPCLVLFEDGKEIGRLVGSQSKSALVNALSLVEGRKSQPDASCKCGHSGCA